jgi:very-short-patch-repair endonuclease
MALRRNQHNYPAARRLRRQLTLPEALLWRELRCKAGGFKFRNQHPVGRYVLDFYCAAAKLGIEVDGIAHDMGDRPERDEQRDAFIGGQGIEVVRVPATDVLRSPVEVAEAIVALCRSRSAIPLHHRAAPGGPPPHPRFRGDGEDL